MEPVKKEALRRIDLPDSSGGAPIPHVFSDEHSLTIAYYVAHTDPAFSGEYTRIVSPTEANEVVAIIHCEYYYAVQAGPPSDEALEGHRLYPLGLNAYSAFEVLNSSWIDALERANRVHYEHNAERFSAYKHFILTFHDTTVEFVAEDFSVSLRRGGVWPVLRDFSQLRLDNERRKTEAIYKELLQMRSRTPRKAETAHANRTSVWARLYRRWLRRA